MSVVGGKKEEKKYSATILSRIKAVEYPEPGVEREVYIITYSAPLLAPGEIRIPVKEWTIEKEKELIRKDIERRIKEAPEKYEV